MAVSYMRVSTQGQTTERQERALQEWMADHPEYELQDKRVDRQSGRNLNRLDWFINGKYPDGTVLIVEDIDRFSRLGVTDGVDLLFRLWKKGLTIAVVGDPFNGDVLKNLDDKGEEIIRELKRARRESDRKRDKSNDAVRVSREQIRQGKFTHPKCLFKPRDGKKKVHYAFWLDLDPTLNNGDGEFVENAEVRWIKRAFELALQPDMGENKIADQLHSEGFRSSHPQTKGKKLDGRTIGKWLTNRQVIGEWQATKPKLDEFGKPVGKQYEPFGEPLSVFPVVIDPKDFQRVQDLRQARRTNAGAVVSRGGQMHSLFQDMQFCAQCGGYMRCRPEAGGKRTFRCSVSLLNKNACNVNGKRVGVPYDEEEILNEMADFRWETFYSDKKHTEELREWSGRKKLAYEAMQKAEDLVKNRKASRAHYWDNGEKVPADLEDSISKAVTEWEAKREAFNRAELTVQQIKARPTGKKAAEATRRRVRQFIDVDRHHPDDATRIAARRAFNQWLQQESLVVVVDARIKPNDPFGRGNYEVGKGTIEVNFKTRSLKRLDMRLEDLAAFGVPPARLKELEKEFADRDAYIDQQLQEAAEAKAEKERNRTPESEAERLAGLEKFKQQIEAHIERRDVERAANPESSKWPQPEKAWPHVDRHALKRVIVQRQTEARAHQSKRPKSLSQQQMQQQQ